MASDSDSSIDGSALAAMSLARLGVDRMFGVVGIPVTSLATRASAALVGAGTTVLLGGALLAAFGWGRRWANDPAAVEALAAEGTADPATTVTVPALPGALADRARSIATTDDLAGLLGLLAADLVDRILIYRAPVIVGEGRSSVGYVGLDAIADAHGRWAPADGASLGIDRLEVYERIRGSKD